MITKIVTWFPAYLYYRWVRWQEKRLGYRVTLNRLKPNWIEGRMVFEMTLVWRRHGIKARGNNYYTIGVVKNGLSTRFDPVSPYYQAWLGCYIVRFEEAREWSAEDHLSLGQADQEYWLRLYGKKTFDDSLIKSEFRKIGKIKLGKYPGELFEGGAWSYSDVGEGNSSPLLKLVMAAGAHNFNWENKELKLVADQLVPQWPNNKLIHSYQQIYLKGYIAIVELDAETRAVAYANAAILKDKNGKERDNFAKIGNELKKTLLATRVVKV